MPTITSRPLHNTDQRLESKRISYHVLLLLLLLPPPPPPPPPPLLISLLLLLLLGDARHAYT